MRRLTLLAALSVVGAGAVPTVSGILNGGSFVQGPIAPGTIVSIFGSGLARAVAQASTLPLPLSLDGTTVLCFSQPNKCTAALSTSIGLRILECH